MEDKLGKVLIVDDDTHINELIDNIEDCINKDFALLPDDEKNHNHYFEYIDDKNSERTYIYLKSKGY